MWCFTRRGAAAPMDSQQAPFPSRQLFVLALCRICEPIAFMSIFPYIYYMIESFQITSSDQTIALYAGMVTSAFAIAEFASGIVWGRLSDKFGRKPILLCGMAGTGISMIAFGFSKSLPVALVARALGGLLNGNIGVLQSVVAEIVKVESHKPLGFAIMPVVWCVGSIVGSVLGGALADPVRNYGWSEDSIFATFPYLLPNLVCTGVVIVGLFIGIFFLEETHNGVKQRRDPFLEAGQRFLRLFMRTTQIEESVSRKRDYMMESLTLQHEQEDESPPNYRSAASSPQLLPYHGPPPPAYQSVEGSPRVSVSTEDVQPLQTNELADVEAGTTKQKAHWTEALTKQTMLNIACYGVLAYHTISAEQLLSVLLSLPHTAHPVQLPFWFTDGFALSTKTIGQILSVQGIIQIAVTWIIYPRISARLGPLMTFRLTALSYPLLYFIVPYVTLAPVQLRMPLVYVILVWKVSAQAFTFPSMQIMLVGKVSNSEILGTLTSIAAASASLARAFGPTISGVLQSAGLAQGMIGLPWWANAGMALAGFVMSTFMEYTPKAKSETEKVDGAPAAAGLLTDYDER